MCMLTLVIIPKVTIYLYGIQLLIATLTNPGSQQVIRISKNTLFERINILSDSNPHFTQ